MHQLSHFGPASSRAQPPPSVANKASSLAHAGPAMRRRVVALCANARCKAVLIAALLTELNNDATVSSSSRSSGVGGGDGAVFGVAVPSVRFAQATSSRGAAQAAVAAATAHVSGAGGGSTADNSDEGSGGGDDDDEAAVDQGGGTVNVLTLLQREGRSAIEVCFVDGGAGATVRPPCLAAALCDVDTRALVLCCEAPDAALGAAAEKSAANALVSAAEAAIDLLETSSDAPRVSVSVLLAVAAAPSSAAGSGTDAVARDGDAALGKKFDGPVGIAMPASPVPPFRSAATSPAAFPSLTTTSTAAAPGGSSVNAAAPRSPVVASLASSSSSQSQSQSSPTTTAGWALEIAQGIYDWLVRWTRLALCVLLFGLSQRVVAWRDKVATLRDAAQLVAARCRESYARGASSSSPTPSLPVVAAASLATAGPRASYAALVLLASPASDESVRGASSADRAALARFVASLRS
jgi:hypothetical protein